MFQTSYSLNKALAAVAVMMAASPVMSDDIVVINKACASSQEEALAIRCIVTRSETDVTVGMILANPQLHQFLSGAQVPPRHALGTEQPAWLDKRNIRVDIPATLKSPGWVITLDGWAIPSSMKCAEPGMNNVVCQIFRKGTELSDNNISDLTREEVLEMFPSLLDFIDATGRFHLNVIAELISPA